MTTDDDAHDLLRIEVVGRGRRAHCSCGWVSLTATSAHAAGRLWDDHAAGAREGDG